MSRSSNPTKAELNRLLKERPELLPRMLLLAAEPLGESIAGPEDLVDAFNPLLLGRETEALAVLALDRRNRVLDLEILTQGCDRFTVVDARQIFRWALTRSIMPSSIAMAHNHPSGDPTPSQQDLDVTKVVGRAGEAVGIPLIDHLIVCASKWSSLAADDRWGSWAWGR